MTESGSLYVTTQVESDDATSGFSCGKYAPDDYLKRHAAPNDRAGIRRASGRNALLPVLAWREMATTEKISVALGRDELRLAKTAAEQDGVSLSAFVTGAVRARIEERRRMEAARKVLESFEPEDFPTAEEQRDLLTLWASPHMTSIRQRLRNRRR